MHISRSAERVGSLAQHRRRAGGQLLYVGHVGPTTSVVDSSTSEVIATLPFTGDVTVDSTSGTAYVANEEDNTIVVVPEVAR